MKTKLDIKFWMTFLIPLVGALVTGVTMFYDLKEDMAKAKIEIEYIKRDVSEIKLTLQKEMLTMIPYKNLVVKD